MIPLIGAAWMVVGFAYPWRDREMPGERGLVAYVNIGAVDF